MILIGNPFLERKERKDTHHDARAILEALLPVWLAPHVAAEVSLGVAGGNLARRDGLALLRKSGEQPQQCDAHLGLEAGQTVFVERQQKQQHKRTFEATKALFVCGRGRRDI